MSAFDSVLKLVKVWEPERLSKEPGYRDSLFVHLNTNLRHVKMIEREYRHLGTTTDIYVKQAGFLTDSEVFVELKRNLLSKGELDRLVGQIESLKPGKNAIIVVLCGESNPSLVARLRQKYIQAPQLGRLIIEDDNFEVVVKTHAPKQLNSAQTVKARR